MERNALSFLLGAITITAAVIASSGFAAGIFALGFVFGMLALGLIAKGFGAARLARFFAKRAGLAEPTAAPSGRRASVRPIKSVDDDTLYARYQKMPKREKMKLELDAWNDAFERDLAEQAEPTAEVAAILSESAPEPVIAAPVDVADEVVSALRNLQVPVKAARAAVAVAQGVDFEPLFKSALAIVREGKAA